MLVLKKRKYQNYEKFRSCRLFLHFSSMELGNLFCMLARSLVFNGQTIKFKL